MSADPIWLPIKSAPERQVIMTKIDDHLGERNVQPLLYDRRLWWAGRMYVYYAPTHWRPMERADVR